MLPEISYFVIFGDSLSDRGTFFKRSILGFPLRRLSYLEAESPKGRHTNGYVWDDYLASVVSNKFLIKHLKENLHWDAEDIVNAVIHHSPHLKDIYTLDNDLAVNFRNNTFMRNYSEAGLRRLEKITCSFIPECFVA